MANRKRFKVSKELRKYIKPVLVRSEIPHKFFCEDGQWYCETIISGERFHKIVQRARCEKKSAEDGVLYLTYRESEDPGLSQAILEQFGKNGYVVISNQTQKNNQ